MFQTTKPDTIFRIILKFCVCVFFGCEEIPKFLVTLWDMFRDRQFTRMSFTVFLTHKSVKIWSLTIECWSHSKCLECGQIVCRKVTTTRSHQGHSNPSKHKGISFIDYQQKEHFDSQQVFISSHFHPFHA
jgi:hypothetical protein